jgi:hypothetical protein
VHLGGDIKVAVFVFDYERLPNERFVIFSKRVMVVVSKKFKDILINAND